MNARGTLIQTALLHKQRKPLYQREDPVNRDRTVKENGVSRFRNALDKSRKDIAEKVALQESIAGDLKLISESGREARAWIERAHKVVSDRANHIENSEDKAAFTELANMLKNAVSSPDATDEEIEQSLRILKQQIDVKEETSSEHLRDVKSHLSQEISGILGPVSATPEVPLQ